MSVAPVDPRRPPLQRAHLVAGGDELGGDGATEEPGRAGDEDDHGATGLRAGEDAVGPDRQPRAVDLGVVPDVGRQARDGEHGDERDAGALAHGTGELRVGEARARGAAGTVSTTATACRSPCGPDADDGGAAHRGDALDLLLGPDRRDRPVGGDDDVRHPPFDPQPAALVEVPDVAGAVPARARAVATSAVSRTASRSVSHSRS